ncbi:MAG: DEAD/DEAH box helicase family protein [Anaerolineales bacterium]|nr:DEAD/DEAH box helicase family protein [Anaerolineales bacterium]
MTLNLGDTVRIGDGKTARIIQLIDLFGRRYADIFIEPAGPIKRELLANLHAPDDRLSSLDGGQTAPAGLFVARIAAHQLRAMLTQQGVLSAANFRVTPLPHQVLAVDWVMNLLRPRAMIADEVGLGKTIEAAMVYEELKLRGQAHRALVIAPAGLTRQWQDEFVQKFGEHFILYDRTMVSALREIHGQETNLWMLNDQVVTSLDFVKPKRMRPDLSAREKEQRERHNQRIFQDIIEAGWDLVIFDEAHKLSKHADGSETARYRVGESLAQAVPVFLLLTATPHQGDAARFLHLLNLVDPYAFNQFDDLDPKKVGSVVWRTRKRAAVDAQGNRLFKQRITDIYPVDRSGPEHALELELYEAVTDYVRDNYDRAMGRGDRAFGFLMILFQRLVTSSTQAIHDALVKRHEKLVSLQAHLNSSGGQEGFDEEAAGDEDTQELLDDLIVVSGVLNEAELAKEIEIIERLLDLARRARQGHDAKMAALLDIIDQVCQREGDPNCKFLIFTEFVATQDAICQLLEGMGYRAAVINGRQKLEERIAARKTFANDAQFMVSTEAGGEGINLQFCHVMVNYDLPWNPMKLEQRIGRLDRIGQTHHVLVLNLLVQDSVEQRIRQVLENKLGLIREQYGEDKLADILSTLQDEFNFDRLYMDAVLKRQLEAAELEQIAQRIYERARQVLEQDDLLMPQAQTRMQDYRRRLAETSQERIRAMLEGYLAANGERLNEYSRRPGVYYFELPLDGSKEHFADVVFDRERAVADDGLVYLHLNHPAVQSLLKHLTDKELAMAQLELDSTALPAGTTLPDGIGLWRVYRLRVTNYEDVDRYELLPVVVNGHGREYPNLARCLMSLAPDHIKTAYIPIDDGDLEKLREFSQKTAESHAADLFSEMQLEQGERLQNERKKIEQYYRNQEIAVGQIAIENIRQAKHRELLERRHKDLSNLEHRLSLVPDLMMIGMALIS